MISSNRFYSVGGGTIEIENIGQIAVKDVVPSDVLTKTASNGTEISDNLSLYNTPEYDENGPTGIVVEKIDVVEWSEDPIQYIASALSPATVLAVDIDEENMTSKVVVPDNQLSLAIGKDGQNARLSAKLTGWKIDIKSESQIKGEV